MIFARTLMLLLLVPAFAMFAACGGDDDDSDDSGDDDSSSSRRDDDNESSGGSVSLPKVRDGQFDTGSVHIEVSGDKDIKFDVKGGGLATNGFTLLTFLDEKASVILTFQADSEDEPGSVSVTSAEFTTGAGWNDGCTVSLEDGTNELKGEFDCKDAEGIDSKSPKDYDVRVKGNFSVQR